MHWDTLTESQQHALWAEQDELEISSLDRGIESFRRNCEESPGSQWPACRQLMASALEAMVDSIEEARVMASSGRGTRGCQGWGIPVICMDPNVLGLATMAAMLDGTARGDNLQASAVIETIGKRVEMEWHFMLLKEEAPKLKAVMDRRVRKWDRRSLLRARQAMGELGKAWPAKMRRQVGAKLLGLAVQHSGMFDLVLTRRGRKSHQEIRLTSEALTHLAEANESLELMSPVTLPMVVPPNNWDSNRQGGYRILGPYYPLVIHRSGSPPTTTDPGPLVYEALNAMQRTPWIVNQAVLDTVQQVWAAGGGWGGLPSTEPIAIPPDFPVEGTREEKIRWKAAASFIHRKNIRTVGKRLAFISLLDTAEEFRHRVFYFPHRADFRGRLYPLPQFLQPQGNDAARGLLSFADRKVLGKTGLRWLHIQFANCWGVDKVSFNDREAWAKGRLDLVDLEQDPLSIRQAWAEADKPWQALATLLELKAAYAHPEGPERYASNLPVSVDGSNSGLQHFSAMLRDEFGARLVNLVPSDKPADIYTDVAQSVLESVRRDAKSQQQTDTTIDSLPRDWLNAGITRKLCKRGTMTYCYGVTQQGLKNALIADGFVEWAENQHAAVTYIGKRIWDAIQSNITGAEQAMAWLRKCADCANKAGVLLHWTTPSGFTVEHPYLDAPYARVSCLSASIHFRTYDANANIMPNRQKSALPPNFVHSLDASHLCMTVAAGKATGLSHWMMIHDSFGVHACDVDTLNIVLREEFVKLYSIDVLNQFRQQVIQQTQNDPGPPPDRGDFDLGNIIDSEYFFG